MYAFDAKEIRLKNEEDKVQALGPMNIMPQIEVSCAQISCVRRDGISGVCSGVTGPRRWRGPLMHDHEIEDRMQANIPFPLHYRSWSCLVSMYSHRAVLKAVEILEAAKIIYTPLWTWKCESLVGMLDHCWLKESLAGLLLKVLHITNPLKAFGVCAWRV